MHNEVNRLLISLAFRFSAAKLPPDGEILVGSRSGHAEPGGRQRSGIGKHYVVEKRNPRAQMRQRQNNTPSDPGRPTPQAGKRHSRRNAQRRAKQNDVGIGGGLQKNAVGQGLIGRRVDFNARHGLAKRIRGHVAVLRRRLGGNAYKHYLARQLALQRRIDLEIVD